VVAVVSRVSEAKDLFAVCPAVAVRVEKQRVDNAALFFPGVVETIAIEVKKLWPSTSADTQHRYGEHTRPEMIESHRILRIVGPKRHPY
jgi:hypothetical protein